MTPRIRSLLNAFDGQDIDSFLVCDDRNVSYLTGFPAHESWLLLTERAAFYVTDFRYILEASVGLADKRVRVVNSRGSLVKAVLSLIKRCQCKVLGLDERHINAALYRRLSGSKPAGLRLKAADGLVDGLRAVKEPGEIAAIREAFKINAAAYAFLKPRIRPGRTGRDLLADLQGFVYRKGVEFSFPPIIAAGPDAAMPHARVSDRPVASGEPLLVDMGIVKDGYKSDLTRMFFLGKMTSRFKAVSEHVKEAQLRAIDVVRPGVAAKVVDSTARNYLKKHGLARYFGHSLGHGVGLDVHEMPSISRKSGMVLAENMVFTIEPGVYFPGEFGVRWEEMVLVTRTGCEVLSDDSYYGSVKRHSLEC